MYQEVRADPETEARLRRALTEKAEIETALSEIKVRYTIVCDDLDEALRAKVRRARLQPWHNSMA